MRRAVGRFVGWLAAHEPIVLVALAIIVACIWLFADVADNVLEGDTRHFDERVLLMLRNAHDPATPVGPPWLAEANRDITALGGTAVLMLMIAAVCGISVADRQSTAPCGSSLRPRSAVGCFPACSSTFSLGRGRMSCRIWPMSTMPASPADIR